jgi:hypothetical protein
VGLELFLRPVYDGGMKRHELLKKDPLTILAAASTRAGLLAACLQGAFSVVGGESDAEQAEQAFSKEAQDFPALLTAVLDDALAAAKTSGVGFSDVTFTLITDKKAVGSFVGKPSKSLGALPKKVGRIIAAPEKNGDGEWETKVEFED